MPADVLGFCGFFPPAGGRARDAEGTASRVDLNDWTPTRSMDPRPIGIIDSGVGGLAVARAVIDRVPNESITYLGDTANAPYGCRPNEEIQSLALELARKLTAHDVKMLVVGCNSIEATTASELTKAAGVPVVGVIEPGVRRALTETRNQRIGVIGTEATISSHAHVKLLARLGHSQPVHGQSCPAFVEFVERGQTKGRDLDAITSEYLAPFAAAGVDTVIMGCTHYDFLHHAIQSYLGPAVQLISSADESAAVVRRRLVRLGLERTESNPPLYEFWCTGDSLRFRRIARRFLALSFSEGPNPPTASSTHPSSNLKRRPAEPELAFTGVRLHPPLHQQNGHM